MKRTTFLAFFLSHGGGRETFGLCIVAQRTWWGYAWRLYRAKKDSLSQASSAASNLRYELAARIARTFANLAAKAIAPFGKF